MHVVTPSAFQRDCTKEKLWKKKKENNEGEGMGVIGIRRGFTFAPEQSSTQRREKKYENRETYQKLIILQSKECFVFMTTLTIRLPPGG